MTYAGVLFAPHDPPADLRLPRLCWRFFAALDGHTPVHVIAGRLGLSADEVSQVVHTLRQHGLISEPVETYADYRAGAAHQAAHAPDTPATAPQATAPQATADASVLSGDGAASPAAEGAALHLPSLWQWIEDTADNTKDYVNTQTFILVEVGDALAEIGVSDVSEIDRFERVDDPDVMRAMERAVERNLHTPIPAHCYTS